MNSVLRDYEEYKRNAIRNLSEPIEKSYIKNMYKKFVTEFENIEDEQVKEYVLKTNIYKIIMNNRRIEKISKEVNA